MKKKDKNLLIKKLIRLKIPGNRGSGKTVLSGFRKEKRTCPPALQSTGESDIPIGMMNAVIRIKNREKTKK